MTGNPTISLIIAVYERPDFLERVLESVLRQSFTDFEVVLADDGSGDAIQKVIDAYQPKFERPIQRVWHEDDGFRKTIIVNQAATKALGDYLVFIDGDCVLHHRFLHQHNARRKRERVLSGRRVMMDRDLSERVTLEDVRNGRIEKPGFWWGHAGKIDRWRGFYVPITFWARNVGRSDYQILGCNFSVHKEDFYVVNGYDERIVGRGMEDVNLCTRFLNAGFEIKNVTFEAIQYHLDHDAEAIPHSEDFIDAYSDTKETRTAHGIHKD